MIEIFSAAILSFGAGVLVGVVMMIAVLLFAFLVWLGFYGLRVMYGR